MKWLTFSSNSNTPQGSQPELNCLSINNIYFPVCHCPRWGWKLNLFPLLCANSMDGFRVVKLNEIIRQVDVIITCTGNSSWNNAGVISHWDALMWDYIFVWHTKCLLVHGPLHCSLMYGMYADWRWMIVSFCREQECGDQRPAGPNEKWLNCLQHGPL